MDIRKVKKVIEMLEESSIAEIETTLSRMVPYRIDRAPQELLPIAPPTVARLTVDGSGANFRPCALAALLRSSMTRPGPTQAHLSSGLICHTSRMYFEVSMTIALLTVCPERDVPAPRGRIATRSLYAKRTALETSSASLGKMTPSGSIWYIEASVL